jgi:hypothetical protein
VPPSDSGGPSREPNGRRLPADSDEFLAILVALGEASGEIDLIELDLGDAERTSALVQAVKGRLDEGHPLRLVHAPQLLAHNLYRIGYLNHPLLGLRETLKDEADAG